MVEKQLIEDISKGVSALRASFEATENERKSDRLRTSETLEKMDKISTRIEALEKMGNDQLTADKVKAITAEAVAEQADRLNKSLEEIEAKFVRGAKGSNGDQKQLTEHQKAFSNALRSGHTLKEITKYNGYSDEAVKALTVAQDLAGGYLAPPEFVQTLVNQNVVEFSNVRPLVTTRTTTAQSILMPTKQRSGGAQWVTEIQTRNETPSIQLGTIEIRTAEMSAVVGISRQDMEDPAMDIEGMVRTDMGEQFALLENIEFLTGDGINKPLGMLTDTDVEYVASGVADDIAADAFIEVSESLKEVYLADASWLLNRDTLRRVRTLKDGEGRYIWAQNFMEGKPTSILGYNYTRAQHMPNVSANTYPVLFGSFRRAYVVVDRLAMSLLVDPYSNASRGIVTIYARKRVGGTVVVPEAIVKMKIAVS